MDKAYLIKQLADLAAAYELDVPEQILDQVISISKFKVYNKGDVLARIGEPSTYAGIVMNGVARCFYVDGDGNDVTRFFACEGNACMDDGLIGNPSYAAMWEALEETTVMLFEAKRMKELIMSSEQIKTIWIELLESGMRYKLYRENGFLVENATERYLSFRKRFPSLIGRVPQQHIATYLGIKPESLSRIKSSLKEEA
ncbi:MAG: Crp/Fnr family transcriptional regulator [Clostridiales bacterium]|nr:Crp/Fnr family transcriptional regulator [Clostridiales bacterium]